MFSNWLKTGTKWQTDSTNKFIANSITCSNPFMLIRAGGSQKPQDYISELHMPNKGEAVYGPQLEHASAIKYFKLRERD